MAASGDKDILLPQEPDPWQALRHLRSWLRRRRPAGMPPVGPDDLCRAFDYLAAECAAGQALQEGLAEVLAARMASLQGQGRLAVQCRLAEVLRRPDCAALHLALYLATRMPVPQARTVLLEMLTQPAMARWSFPLEPTSSGNGSSFDGPRQTFDLRPMVVAALGQLRDPSLLGLFHRLLDKLGARPTEHLAIVAAVQWSLMNLAPGGQGEPMPAAILNDRCGGGPEGQSPWAFPGRDEQHAERHSLWNGSKRL